MDADQKIDQGCRFDLVIGSIFQNEAPYLKEWIEFHRMVGVQRFILVDDRSTDDYLDVLRPYIDAGEVQLLRSPCPEKWQGRDWITYQCAIIRAFCEQLRGVARWLALIDVDEFIVPAETDNLVELLASHEDLGGVYIRWEPFGTSYVQKLASDELLTEKLHLKGKLARGSDMLGKSIVKPHRVLHPNIHRCTLLPGYQYLDSNPGMENERPPIQLNHYWTRDEYFLLNEKLPRTARIKGWEIDEERIEFFKHAYNEVPDLSMKRFIPDLKRRVFSAG